MTLRIFYLLLSLTLICYSNTSWALGQIGHQLVCQLSFELLSPSDQQKVQQLLSTLPKQQQNRINKYTHQASDTPINFATACTWPDAIKKDPQFSAFNAWHFLNVARDQLTLPANACQKNCVSYAISYHSTQLQDGETTEQRLQALMFLGHWLGDIHQPLHVSFASDLGGNKNQVTPAVGRCKNLHWYWDECLLYPLDKPKDNFDYSAFKRNLYESLKQKLANAPVQEWRNSSVTDWANESLNLVRDAKLQYCHQQAKQCLSNQDHSITITCAYHQQFQAVLTQRILQAAVRLSDLLHQHL